MIQAKRKQVDLIERAKIAEERIRKLRRNITIPESIIMELLDKTGERYIFQEAFFDKYYFLIADFFLPDLNVIIEVDGAQHGEEKKRKQEAKRRRWLKSKGITVVRIKNKAAYKMTKNSLLKRIYGAKERFQKRVR